MTSIEFLSLKRDFKRAIAGKLQLVIALTILAYLLAGGVTLFAGRFLVKARQRVENELEVTNSRLTRTRETELLLQTFKQRIALAAKILLEETSFPVIFTSLQTVTDEVSFEKIEMVKTGEFLLAAKTANAASYIVFMEKFPPELKQAFKIISLPAVARDKDGKYSFLLELKKEDEADKKTKK